MRKLIYINLIIAVLLFSGNLSSQVTQEWVRFYSNNDGGDLGAKIGLDGAGNIYVTGTSYDSISGNDFLTIKYNPGGVQQWVQRYNGPGNGSDQPSFFAVDNSGNTYTAGASAGTGNMVDYAIVKYNASGVQQWVKRYNGALSIAAIGTDNSGNFYVAGTGTAAVPPLGTLSVMRTIKYNYTGAQVWAKNYIHCDTSGLNPPAYAYAKVLTVDNSGYVYVSAFCFDGMYMSFCATIKYDTVGDSLWVQRTSIQDFLMPCAIATNSSGYVFLTGNNGLKFVTIKYNSSGIKQWMQQYAGQGYGGNTPFSIAVDLNNVYITGISMGINSSSDYTTVKYDFSGVQQWARIYNGIGNGIDWALSIKLDSLSNSYVTGWGVGSGGQPDFVTIKYDYFGNQKWLMSYNGASYDIAVNNSGNVYVTGYSEGNFTTIKYSQQIGIQNISTEIPLSYSLGQNYPNPFNPSTNIKFQVKSAGVVKLVVLDILGKEIATLVNEKLQPGTYETTFDASAYPSGAYFYRIETGTFTDVKRMILIK